MLKVRLEKIYFKVKDEDKDYEDIFSGDIVEKANSTVGSGEHYCARCIYFQISF
jgi:hypothetical protein